MPQSSDFGNLFKSLPNKLTLVRIAVIPVLVLLYPFNVSFLNVFCAVLFALAALTDFFDGYLARKLGEVTRFGAVFDPVADKLLSMSALVLLISQDRVPAFMGVILLGRDIAVAGMRTVAAEQNSPINVSQQGKIKTAVMDVAIVCLLVDSGVYHTIGIIGIWAAMLLSLYSAYEYWKIFAKHVT